MIDYKKAFYESFLDRNNKIDHKRLTAFVFVIMFFLTAVIALFSSSKIINMALVETVLYIQGAVIGSAMGFSMINKPSNTINQNEVNKEFYPPGDAPQ